MPLISSSSASTPDTSVARTSPSSATLAATPTAQLTPNISYFDDFVSGASAQALYDQLLQELEFKAESYVFNGVEVLSKRRVSYHSEHSYAYSNQAYAGKAWTPTLTLLRQMILEKTGHDFNAVLCNYYENGQAAMGWHSDSEKELGPDPVIASLSFGQTRKFAFRPRRTFADKNPKKVCEYLLGQGDLLVMEQGTQPHFEHALLVEKNAPAARMNLTFRKIIV